MVWLTEWLLLEWARPVRTVICNQDLQEVVKPGEIPQSALSCSCFWNRLNKLQHANLHLYLRKDTRHVVYKANTLTYHEVAARAQWITHKHTIKDTKHLMRLSGLYLWFSTSDFWKFRCVARWFWFILRGELLRNPIWFSAVRTKAIDYGENKDRLAVREFNSFGGAEHRRLLGLLLKTEKRKTWYFLGRTLHASHWGDELSLLFCTAWHFCLNSNHLNVNGNYKACLVVYISTVSKPKLVFWWKKWHIISCLKGYFKSTLKKKLTQHLYSVFVWIEKILHYTPRCSLYEIYWII